jgi:hypothetical protein
MTYAPTPEDMNRLYAAIGFQIEHELDYIMIHGTAVKGDLYMKVFSNRGAKDAPVGQALRDYLTLRAVQFTSTNPRAVTITDVDFERLFGPNSVKPMFLPNQFDTNFKRLVDVIDALGVDFAPANDIDNYRPLLDLSNPEVSQFFNDWKAYVETKQRFNATLSGQLALQRK